MDIDGVQAPELGLAPLDADDRRIAFEAKRRSATFRQTSVRRAHVMVRATIRSRLIETDHRLVESSLVEHLAMSRNAVREALQRLAAEGLVERRTRFGTSVAGRIMRLPATEPWPVSRRELDGDGEIVVRELEQRAVPATQLLCQRLGTPRYEQVLMTEHLVEVGEAPFCVRVSYRRMPPGLIPPAPRDPEAPMRPGPPMRPEDAFSHLRGPLLGELESSAESVAGEPRTSRLLDLPEESAILLRETFVRSADGSPFELAFTWYRGDRVAIVSSGQAL